MGARVGVVVVAAGQGSRFGGPVPKAFTSLGGRPLLAWALDAVAGCPGLAAVVVVAPPGHDDEAEALRHRAVGHLPGAVVPGGPERSDSVAAGLRALPDDVEVVLVHDAARALVPAAVFVTVVDSVCAGHPAVVPGLPVVDTVKEVDASGTVVGTVDRHALRVVQTPQGFARSVLEDAHRAGAGSVTDDAMLVESLGVPVLVVPGDPVGLKITTPDDLALAELLLARTYADEAMPT